VGDTGGQRAIKSREPETQQPEQQSGGASEPSGRYRDVGQPVSSSRWFDEPGWGSDRRGTVGRPGEELADSASIDGNERIGQRVSDSAGAGRESGAEGFSEGMADSEREGSQGDRSAVPQRRNFFEPCDADRGIFAPGPGSDWQTIPETLWPAIEPGFRVLVDGVAMVLDASRGDALRCGGNGVVPLQGAVAFVELMRQLTR
jgi:DNA (cytosine-5)-methyltransferase 1